MNVIFAGRGVGVMSPIDTGHSSADAKFNCSADQPELCGTVSLLLCSEHCYKWPNVQGVNIVDRNKG